MSKTILYVEDNAANRVLVRQVLEGVGYIVLEATDGLSGIKAAQETHPDLILMDINIPGMDGYEAATRIKSLPELSDIPIIALTAKVMAGDRERALAAGCNGYIAKPIDVDTLPQQVAEFLGGMRESITIEQESAYLREYNERLVDRLEKKVQELTKANEALAHTDAMKSRFINLAAHELRTPLAAVHGYLSLLTSSDSSFMAQADEKTLQVIEGVVTGVDRLRGIVQDMLDVTRIEAGTLQLKHAPIGLSLILDKIKKDFKNVVARRQQTLLVADADHIPTLWADGERVTQILRNLVSNAIKYTPDGGIIEIKVDLLGDDSDFARNSPAPQPFVKITVSDTGVGIAAEEQDRIFENFYEVRDIERHSTSKTEFMGGGTGLGLAIARGVAQAHGGSLWVESEGHDPVRCPGSQFHLILPLGEPAKD
ncbi:MAG: hybrid sensor histidine kinase/response regulator [Anaerolineae bacterium]|nr:hybrid sensor histidine kinase/response regulator [Anaerolineales bacterium]MCQ3971959.1 hybrid sensor histidine kinase/response regulator [Anaerolineae bacterium]